MREASRTQRHRNRRKKQIWLLIPATRCSDPHSVLVKLIHVACNGTRQPRVYRQPGMIERHSSWILVLLHTPEPLNVTANTVHNISITIENDVLPQHHHVEQPLRNKSCRVIFYEKVSVDDPQRVLLVPKTGWWCLFNILNTACCQSALVPLVVFFGDIDHFASTQPCLCRRRRCWYRILPLQLVPCP